MTVTKPVTVTKSTVIGLRCTLDVSRAPLVWRTPDGKLSAMPPRTAIIRPTTKKVSLADIAARAGVSVPTVARILAGGNKEVWVGASARADRVRQAAEELGYRPNHAASSLAAGTSSTIALAVSEQGFFDTGIYLPLLHMALRAATAAGFHLLPVMMGGGSDAWRKRLIDDHVAGVLVTQPAPDDLPETLLRFKVPTVLLNLESDLPLPQVRFADGQGIRLALEHLAGLGHRRIVHWDELPGLIDGHFSATLRRRMVDAEAARLKLVVRRPVAFAETIAQCPETAVLCSDRSARDLLLACHRSGRRVPDQLSVIGINDEYAAEWTIPPLTTVHVPVEDLVLRGLALLQSAIAGDAVPLVAELLPERLVVRGTTAAPHAG